MHRFLCLMLGLVIPVVVVASAAAQTAASAADKPTEKATAKVTQFEVVPPNEDAQIDSVVSLTVQQMKNRYSGATTALRGVHPKDHGCVKAAFEILPELPKEIGRAHV